MMGLGIGFVCSMVAVQLPNDFIARVGQILLAAGVVTFVAGAIQLRKHLLDNADNKLPHADYRITACNLDLISQQVSQRTSRLRVRRPGLPGTGDWARGT
jgi:hypothetical protein